VRALELAGEELQPDAGRLQLLGQRRQLDAAAEPLVLRPSRLCWCTTIVTATPDARSSRARATARSSSGRVAARVEIFSAKTRVTPEARSESVWVSSD
jgi:hypothetical protein